VRNPFTSTRYSPTSAVISSLTCAGWVYGSSTLGVRKQPTEMPFTLGGGNDGGTPMSTAFFPSIARWSQIVMALNDREVTISSFP
jgi:hypothetical protein